MARTKPGGIAANLPGAGKVTPGAALTGMLKGSRAKASKKARTEAPKNDATPTSLKVRPGQGRGMATRLPLVPSPDKLGSRQINIIKMLADGGINNPLIVSARPPGMISPALTQNSPLNELTRTGLAHPSGDLMRFDPTANAQNLATISLIPGFRRYAGMDPDIAGPLITDQMMGNLLEIRNRTPREMLDAAGLWYPVGANGAARRMADDYGVDRHGAVAAIAATSPRTEWDLNLERARRLTKIYSESGRLPTSKSLVDFAVSNFGESHPGVARLREIADARLSIDDLMEAGDLEGAALVTQLLDRMIGPQPYYRMNTDGTFTDILGHGYSPPSTDNIKAAISALRDPSNENLSAILSPDSHKVRNFNNNIAEPWDDLWGVTIDTHAASAALLTPYSSSSPIIEQAFGRGPGIRSTANTSGSRGVTGIYGDAYRALSRLLGGDVPPWMVQSQTWVPWRQINGAKRDRILDIWNRYDAGEMTLQDARNEVLNYMIPGGKMIPLIGHNSRGRTSDD